MLLLASISNLQQYLLVDMRLHFVIFQLQLLFRDKRARFYCSKSRGQNSSNLLIKQMGCKGEHGLRNKVAGGESTLISKRKAGGQQQGGFGESLR